MSHPPIRPVRSFANLSLPRKGPRLPHPKPIAPLHIAVVGAGVSGLSAAWLLAKRHRVTLYEADNRLGGHANTVDAQTSQGVTPIDTGFVVYNEPNYPNLAALFRHLEVETQETDMSFGVSLDDGAFEYASTNLGGLLAQRRNIVSPRFWAMVRDIRRFQRDGEEDAAKFKDHVINLADYLDQRGFCRAFREDHLLPQAAAIWSASTRDIREYPAASMLRFFHNHGLMRLRGRPVWRTVVGGSRSYVAKLMADFSGEVLSGRLVVAVTHGPDGQHVHDAFGETRRYDAVVIAAHADQALAMLEAPTAEEQRVLGAFRYSRNAAVMHGDARLMPKRKAAWSSWNHVGKRGVTDSGVTYWMNRLHRVETKTPVLVSINPTQEPNDDSVMWRGEYDHPLFDGAAMAAQKDLWSLQGAHGVWFCGAYFGSGFHEDGLQAGLAVAEQLGGAHRPWVLPEPSGRIHVTEPESAAEEMVA